MVNEILRAIRGNALVALALGVLSVPALGQDFSSGSDGSDGALTFAASAGTIVFDPVALGLDADGDNVFHFTTITIPSGTTVKLSADLLGGEGKGVVWLATDVVDIDGTLDLSGAWGHGGGSLAVPAIAGAGGWNGGDGGTDARAGNGPGGGKTTGVAGTAGGHGGFGAAGAGSNAGGTYGTKFLLPIIGGSGGAGGEPTANGLGQGGGGGAGGGAICIASSAEILLAGSIVAGGGIGGGAQSDGISAVSGAGGGGSGGGVRLMADRISGAGTIDVHGFAFMGAAAGGHGRIRLEAFDNDILASGNFVPVAAVTHGNPLHVLPPAAAPSVRVTSVASIALPENPTGSFTPADVVIDTADPVTIEIAAENIPLGTEITLVLNSENGDTVTVLSSGLTGTIGDSTATATATLPAGFTRGIVTATWDP